MMSYSSLLVQVHVDVLATLVLRTVSPDKVGKVLIDFLVPVWILFVFEFKAVANQVNPTKLTEARECMCAAHCYPICTLRVYGWVDF